MNERRLDALTSTRFLACLLVVMYHYVPDLVRGVAGVEPIVRSGYLGVTFFFALSGFVLAAVYGRRPRVEPRRFYVARFARIYPVYLLSILITAVPYYVSKLAADYPGVSRPVAMAEILGLRLTMLSAWAPGFALRLNGPAWSLSVEAFFYLLFPFALVWMSRTPGAARRAAILAILVANFGLGYLLSRDGDNPLYAWYRYLPLAHLGTFLVGCEAGRAYLEREARGGADGPLALVGLGLILAGILLPDVVPYGLLHNGLLAVPFGIVILWLARNDARLGLLRWGPLVLLGEASYGVYILQSPFGSAMERLAPKLHLPGPKDSLPGFAVYLAVLVGAAILSFRVFETPARGWLRAREEARGKRQEGIV